MPVYYFGLWDETLLRWQQEGIADLESIPAVTGMDPDWEAGMWDTHGLMNINLIAPQGEDEVIDETPDYRVVRTPLGDIMQVGKLGSSIPHYLEHALKPTRESWHQFQRYLDPCDPSRYAPDWRAKGAHFNRRNRVATFLAGSLYGWPREWMGVEAISYLPYDDPLLFEEIIAFLTDRLIALYKPLLQQVQFDFAYIFEDCCSKTGPLLSPRIYESVYRKYYRKLVDFYHDMGVPFVMLDSDGKVDALMPLWLESGIDIVFPIEVGTWQANPAAFRKRYGKRLRMFGGVNKLAIPLGDAAIRAELAPLRELAAEGGYIPIPDHRIPPNCSLEQFKTYVRVFKEVFAQ
jgi:uroporphyrinogen decarboxylase